MEKRKCHRFNVPGTTIVYKKNKRLMWKEDFPDLLCPVLDISRGGLRFLIDDRPKIGLAVKIKLTIPGVDQQPEINGIVRWVSRNWEASYRYQIGVSFNAYGDGKKDNSPEILGLIKSLEPEYPPVGQAQ